MSDTPRQPPPLRHLTLPERQRCIAEWMGVTVAEVTAAFDGLDGDTAHVMVENAVGSLGVPLGVAVHMLINGTSYLVPMATEEPSVIAAASHAAKRVKLSGGFCATSDEPVMAAQIEVCDVADPAGAVARIAEAEAELIEATNAAAEGLYRRGGGGRGADARVIGDGHLVVHIYVDCRDAMGANALNTVAEALAPRVAELCGGAAGLRILSNYCDRRKTRVTATIAAEHLGTSADEGALVGKAIERASLFAERDPYRAVTHNKGIMNGVDAVVLATGNDWRAVEAAAHAYAAHPVEGAQPGYRPLSRWRFDEDVAELHGEMEMPLALGIVGGALRVHPGARAALRLLQVTTAAELAQVAAATGLASNLAALRALATEGIQRGHMALHRRTETS